MESKSFSGRDVRRVAIASLIGATASRATA